MDKTISRLEPIAIEFAKAIVQKDGAINRNDVIKCFEMAETFSKHKTWIKEYNKHIKEVREAERTRICGCGNVLRDGQRIYDHGWEIGYECSACH